jgi:hypothetical protein
MEFLESATPVAFNATIGVFPFVGHAELPVKEFV